MGGPGSSRMLRVTWWFAFSSLAPLGARVLLYWTSRRAWGCAAKQAGLRSSDASCAHREKLLFVGGSGLCIVAKSLLLNTGLFIGAIL